VAQGDPVQAVFGVVPGVVWLKAICGEIDIPAAGRPVWIPLRHAGLRDPHGAVGVQVVHQDVLLKVPVGGEQQCAGFRMFHCMVRDVKIVG